METRDFEAMLGRAREGDPVAVRDLLEEFEADVRAIVRVRLPRLLRSKFDSVDFVQSVWASVLVKGSGQGTEFSDADHFRRYLAGIATNKVLAEYRRRTRTRKYDMAREEPLYRKGSEGHDPRPIAAPDPTPSVQVQKAETLERLIQGRNPVETQLVALLQEGLTQRVIADRLGVNERSVRRLISNLARRVTEDGMAP